LTRSVLGSTQPADGVRVGSGTAALAAAVPWISARRSGKQSSHQVRSGFASSTPHPGSAAGSGLADAGSGRSSNRTARMRGFEVGWYWFGAAVDFALRQTTIQQNVDLTTTRTKKERHRRRSR
jgi:hypothetical protein